MCCGKNIVTRVVSGAVGLAKAALSLDQAPADVIELRRAKCRACPHAVPCKKTPGKFCFCDKCRCLLTAKTSLASQECPLEGDAKQWGKVKKPDASAGA